MKISGFTVIRNAQVMGYPVIPSIKSILPLVDEFIVGIGQSDPGDETEKMIRQIQDPKIQIFHSHWDTAKQKGGLILSEKTNEALDRCTGDWCFYLQADEVVHEGDLPLIHQACEKHLKNQQVEGLLFRYVHFYGSYSVVAAARNWYRNEVRIVKRGTGVRSVGDAQGFRMEGRKPRVKPANASIFHYGWVKPPRKMGEKNKHMFRWWHGHKFDDAFNNFEYTNSYGLKIFKGSHPAVMRELVAAQDWTFVPKFNPVSWTLRDYKNLLSDVTEAVFRKRFGEHKNYELIK